MKLIVGLGNPGRQYQGTRHNVGWRLLELFADDCRANTWSESKFQGLLAEAFVDHEKVLLLKPTTYMNASGESVAATRNYFKIDLEDILVIQDEMDFAPGSFALLAKGGPAGHNGVTSIQELLHTTEIHRLRIGIGRPTPPMKKEDYVLGHFSEAEEEVIQKCFPQMINAVKDWVLHGIDKSMNTWNGV